MSFGFIVCTQHGNVWFPKKKKKKNNSKSSKKQLPWYDLVIFAYVWKIVVVCLWIYYFIVHFWTSQGFWFGLWWPSNSLGLRFIDWAKKKKKRKEKKKLTITENKLNCIEVLLWTCGYRFFNVESKRCILKLSSKTTNATRSIMKLIITTWPRNSPLIL